MTTFQYPTARRDDTVIEILHGKRVTDPYRWMEDPNSKETQDFIEAEQKVTLTYLESCTLRNELGQRLENIWKIPYYSCPRKHGERYYYFKSIGIQNQSSMYSRRTLIGPDSDEKLFFDFNSLSPNGTVFLQNHKFSDNNKLFAYSLCKNGSDWMTIRIKNVNTGEDYPEILEKVKLSWISWTKDNLGFYYSCYWDHVGKYDGTETTANTNMKLYYHRVGTLQVADELAVEFNENPTWRMVGQVSTSGQYLILIVSHNCQKTYKIFYADLIQCAKNSPGQKLQLTPLISEFEATYEFLVEDSNTFYFRTNKNAPNGRVVKIFLSNPEETSWETVIGEDLSRNLQWVVLMGKEIFILCYIENARNVLEVRNLINGRFDIIPVSCHGYINSYTFSWDSQEFIFMFESYLIPKRIYRIDLSTSTYNPIQLYDTPNNIDMSKFVISQILYSSKDGTSIPMSIIHKNDLQQNGTSPCLMYGYGGFSNFLAPTFSELDVTFIDSFNGVVALPNIRGGCEFGVNWYNAGRTERKQNCFDDFQSAAEYLISANYTNPQKLVIHGHSNGGLLVGACVNQRPDLFGAAILKAGIFDIVRFHKFTLGLGWTSEYGNPEVPEDFEYLYKYSPLHNIRFSSNLNIQYPALLVTTSDHDDRVIPAHSLKYIAEIQYKIGQNEYQGNPLLLFVDKNSGHGYGKPTGKRIEDDTNFLCFLVSALDLKIFNN